jgi:hypothetical protein
MLHDDMHFLKRSYVPGTELCAQSQVHGFSSAVDCRACDSRIYTALVETEGSTPCSQNLF